MLQPFPFGSFFLRTKRFLFLLIANSLLALLLAFLPLTHVLGFEFSLFMGFLFTIFFSHYTLATLHALQEQEKTFSWSFVLSRLLATGVLSLLAPLAIISLNALRVTNCNYTHGFLLFLLFAGVGVAVGAMFGTLLALIPSRKVAYIGVYVSPLLHVLFCVLYGLLEPPIHAYNPYFGFYPGTIYDELREITPTFVAYRSLNLVMTWGVFSFVALFAGKNSWIGKTFFSWKEPLLQSKEPLESKLFLLGIFFVSIVVLGVGHFYRAELGYRHSRQSIEKALGGKKETKHFTLLYDHNSFSKKDVEKIALDHEFRYWQLSRFFNLRLSKKIRSFVFRSPKQKASFMGAANTMIARPWAYEIYIHGKHFPHPVLKHELVHVFSAEFGVGPLKMSVRKGILFHASMVEGVAVAADGSRGGLSAHQWCKAMMDLGLRPRPSQIIDPLGFFSQSSLMAYQIAGSFSLYLMKQYGIEKYKKVYGLANFNEIYGKSILVLEKEWEKFLQKNIRFSAYEKAYAENRFARIRSIFVKICPHEIAALREKKYQVTKEKQWPRAIVFQKKICSFLPKTYSFLSLAELYRSNKEYKKAENIVEKILQKPKAMKPFTRTEVQQSLLDLWLLQKKYALAKPLLQELQKKNLSSSMSRSLWIKHYALSQPLETRETLLNYLLKRDSKYFYRLLHLANQKKDNPVLWYLVFRKMYLSKDYEFTLRQPVPFEKKLGTQPEKGIQEIQFEMERMQAMSHYYLKQYPRAIRLFEQRLQRSLSEGENRLAQDWIQRCQWEMKQNNSTKDP